MKVRTSMRNPPKTSYTRPVERRFYVWQDLHITYCLSEQSKYRRAKHPWRWLCTYCDPPTAGFRSTPDAREKIFNTSMPRHFRVRHYHHKYVREMDARRRQAGAEG